MLQGGSQTVLHGIVPNDLVVFFHLFLISLFVSSLVVSSFLITSFLFFVFPFLSCFLPLFA